TPLDLPTLHSPNHGQNKILCYSAFDSGHHIDASSYCVGEKRTRTSPWWLWSWKLEKFSMPRTMHKEMQQDTVPQTMHVFLSEMLCEVPLCTTRVLGENNVSFSGVVLGVEESMPVYDTDIEDVIEEEEGFVGKGEFGEEEENIEDVVVAANDLCSSMIQTTLSVDFEEDINTKSHELMWFEKCIIIKASKSSFKFLIGKKYQEGYLKAAPMVDKLGFKTIKV
ncbi:hypothetical protein Tco_1477112, partial [Tanacetum coccineum]